MVEASGSGDVDMRTTVKATGSGDALCVKGLSGRTLQLNAAWENPSGVWRVGCKRLSELLPGGLATRLKKERAGENENGLGAVRRGNFAVVC